MRHGYTNRTDLTDQGVRKTYAGPDAQRRAHAEYVALSGLVGKVPVPPVIERCADGALVMEFVEGGHGQDLIEAGHAAKVLSACGALLRSLHDVDPRAVGSSRSAGVLCHGDFGPNNLLLDRTSFAVTALLDWEFSGVGEAIVDIAWCEWIVRMHHPNALACLPAFFDAYGERPLWEMRHKAMLRRCRWLEAFCRRWIDADASLGLWQHRTRTTAAWGE